MNEITSFIDSLDLGFEPIEEGSGYIISLDNSDDFSSVYNKLFLKFCATTATLFQFTIF